MHRRSTVNSYGSPPFSGLSLFESDEGPARTTSIDSVARAARPSRLGRSTAISATGSKVNLSEAGTAVTSFCQYYGPVPKRPTGDVLRVLEEFDVIIVDTDQVDRDFKLPENAGALIARVDMSATGALEDIGARAMALLSGFQPYSGLLLVNLGHCLGSCTLDELTATINSLCKTYPERGVFVEEMDNTVFEAVRIYIRGVLMVQPTLHKSGHILSLHGERRRTIDRYASRLRDELAMRDDFVVLVQEAVSKPTAVTSHGVIQFHAFLAGDGAGFVGHLSVDPTFTDASKISPLIQSIGGMGLLRQLPVGDFVAACRSKFVKRSETDCRPLDRPEDIKTELIQAGVKNVTVMRLVEQLVEIMGDGAHEKRHIDRKLIEPFLEPEPGHHTEEGDICINFDDDTLPSNDSIPSLYRDHGGQKDVGIHTTVFDHSDVLNLLSEVRTNSLLTCLSEKKSREIFSGSETSNDVVVASDPLLSEALDRIEAVVDNPDIAADILAVFSPQERQGIIYGLKALLKKIEGVPNPAEPYATRVASAQVWHVDSSVLRIPSRDSREPDHRGYVSLAEVADGVLHLYISREHPNLAEALVYLYFHMCGFAHTYCVILEGMVRQHQEYLLSDRMLFQIQQASYRQLCMFVERTSKIECKLEYRDDLSDEAIMYAKALSEEIDILARRRLLIEVDEDQRRMARGAVMVRPRYFFEESLETEFGPSSLETPHVPGHTASLDVVLSRLVRIAAWNADGLAALNKVCLKLHATVEDLPEKGSIGRITAMVYLVLIRTVRDVMLNVWEVRIRAIDPFPVREVDVITTYLQMLGVRDEDTIVSFELPLRKVSAVLYRRIRGHILDDPPPPEHFVPPPVFPKKMIEEPEATQFTNGLFFIFPALVDLLLLLLYGPGIFASPKMDGGEQKLVALAMMVGLISAGGPMNSIARIGSYHQFQSAFTILPIVLFQRLLMGVIISSITGLLPLIAIALMQEDGVNAVLAYGFTFFLANYLNMLAAMYLFRVGSPTFSTGNYAIVSSVAFLLFPIFMDLVATETFANSQVYLYLGSLAFSTFFLLGVFVYLSYDRFAALNGSRMAVLSADGVLKWYADTHNGAAPPGKAQAREARTAFQERMAVLMRWRHTRLFLHSSKIKQMHPAEFGKLRAFLHEERLMKWYCSITSTRYPEVWGQEWEGYLEQALGAISEKFASEKVIRGSLTWVFELSNIIYGILYFSALFLDRLVRLFVGLDFFLFLPAEAGSFDVAVAWATAFLLLSASTLEIVIAKYLGEREEALKRRSVGDTQSDFSKLTRHRNLREAFLYVRQLINLFVYCVVFATLVGVLMYVSRDNLVSRDWLTLEIAIFGYLGMLWGLFNKIFLVDYELLYNLALFLANVSGLLVSALAVTFTDDKIYSVIALPIAGWSFGIITFFMWIWSRTHISFTLNRQRRAAAKKKKLIERHGEHISQIWVGQDKDSLARSGRIDIAELEPHKSLEIVASTGIGERVWEMMITSARRSERVPETTLLKAAMPNCAQHLRDLAAAFKKGTVRVFLVPEELLRMPDGRGYSAVSTTQPHSKQRKKRRTEALYALRIFVGIPWLERDSPDVTRQAAEALICEGFERMLLQPHRVAVLGELLLSLSDHSLEVPQRILRQLETASREQLSRIEQRTDDVILEHAALSGGILSKWEKQPPHIRRVCVKIFENMRPGLVGASGMVKVLTIHSICEDANVELPDVEVEGPRYATPTTFTGSLQSDSKSDASGEYDPDERDEKTSRLSESLEQLALGRRRESPMIDLQQRERRGGWRDRRPPRVQVPATPDKLKANPTLKLEGSPLLERRLAGRKERFERRISVWGTPKGSREIDMERLLQNADGRQTPGEPSAVAVDNLSDLYCAMLGVADPRVEPDADALPPAAVMVRQLNERIAQSQLCVLLAIYIKKLCRVHAFRQTTQGGGCCCEEDVQSTVKQWTFGTHRTDNLLEWLQPVNLYKQWSILKRLTYHSINTLRLIFLSLTGDSSFGREYHWARATPPSLGGLPMSVEVFLRYPLRYLHLWALAMNRAAMGATIYRLSADSRMYVDAVLNGMHRRLLYKDSRVVAVQVFNTPEPMSGFVEYYDGDGGDEESAGSNGGREHDAELRVYAGIINKEAGKPIFVVDYRRRGPGEPLRAWRRRTMTKTGAVASTGYYVYADKDSAIPSRQQIYSGLCEPPDRHESRQVQINLYDAEGRVVQSLRWIPMSTQSSSDDTELITSSYSYSDAPSVLVQRPLQASHVNEHRGWTLTVRRWRFVNGRRMPVFLVSSVLLRVHSSDESFRSDYHYTHSSDPELRTVRVASQSDLHVLRECVGYSNLQRESVGITGFRLFALGGRGRETPSAATLTPCKIVLTVPEFLLFESNGIEPIHAVSLDDVASVQPLALLAEGNHGFFVAMNDGTVLSVYVGDMSARDEWVALVRNRSAAWKRYVDDGNDANLYFPLGRTNEESLMSGMGSGRARSMSGVAGQSAMDLAQLSPRRRRRGVLRRGPSVRFSGTDGVNVTKTLTAQAEELRLETPSIVTEDPYGLIGQQPISSFFEEDLCLFNGDRHENERGKKLKGDLYSSYDKEKRLYSAERPSTQLARHLLWASWKQAGGKFPGAFARQMDELILRRDGMLTRYWHFRDRALADQARAYLLDHERDLLLMMHMDSRPQFRSHLIIRFADLLNLADGGDIASIFGDVPGPGHEVRGVFNVSNAERVSLMDRRGGTKLQVMGLDSGTWPMDGGGVASCRRDVINRLVNVQWHMVSEIGSDTRLLQDAYQIENNVGSMTLVPLWGSDFGSPNQSINKQVVYGELFMRKWMTSDAILRRFFMPIFRLFVDGLHQQRKFTLDDMEAYTMLFVNMHVYFQHFDWVDTWGNEYLVEYWYSVILQHEPDVELIDAEKPTLQELRDTLGILVRFLMPINVRVPSHISVTHSTHHGIQAILGVIAKRLYGTSFVIWDHGVLWRERLVAFSQFTRFSLFGRNMLVNMTRVMVLVNLYNADVVVPCTSIQNPDWEAWLGGLFGDEHLTRMFERKINPVVNGMEMDRFGVERKTELEKPTALMLSHVYPLKDVMTAIQAAVEIVNKYKVEDYRLIVYGSVKKDPPYVQMCRNIISQQGLDDKVELRGLGNAPKVIPQGWIFLNSSQSEGLPLALGEAGLCGLPVVCTDVGGSREIVRGGKLLFGQLSPPKDADTLARAELTTLAMLEHLDEFAKDLVDPVPAAVAKGRPPIIDDFYPLNPDGPNLTERIYQVSSARRKLGMQFRAKVLSSFNMDTYLRRHATMLYIGRDWARRKWNMDSCQELPSGQKMTSKKLFNGHLAQTLRKYNRQNMMVGSQQQYSEVALRLRASGTDFPPRFDMQRSGAVRQFSLTSVPVLEGVLADEYLQPNTPATSRAEPVRGMAKRRTALLDAAAFKGLANIEVPSSPIATTARSMLSARSRLGQSLRSTARTPRMLPKIEIGSVTSSTMSRETSLRSSIMSREPSLRSNLSREPSLRSNLSREPSLREPVLDSSFTPALVSQRTARRESKVGFVGVARTPRFKRTTFKTELDTSQGYQDAPEESESVLRPVPKVRIEEVLNDDDDDDDSEYAAAQAVGSRSKPPRHPPYRNLRKALSPVRMKAVLPQPRPTVTMVPTSAVATATSTAMVVKTTRSATVTVTAPTEEEAAARAAAAASAAAVAAAQPESIGPGEHIVVDAAGQVTSVVAGEPATYVQTAGGGWQGGAAPHVRSPEHFSAAYRAASPMGRYREGGY